MKIISLIASATEIVCALGLADKLVGRSHECDYPPAVKDLPVCTQPKFRLDGTSYEIDQRVKAIVAEAMSVYRVDPAMVEALSPTHIITQSQCEVCAVSISDVEEAVCQLTSTRPLIVSLEPNSLADIFSDIKRVGQALAVEDRADRLVRETEEALREISTKAARAGNRPGVACIEWIEPLMAAGNWTPELIELAGGVNLFGQAGVHSPWMTWDELKNADPEIVLVSPCGFDIARTLEETGLLTERPGWRDLQAARNGKVFVADGNQYFNRPGPRLKETLEILSEVIHPELFDFGHEGRGWIRLPAN